MSVVPETVRSRVPAQGRRWRERKCVMVARRRRGALWQLAAIGVFMWVWLNDVEGIRTWAAQAIAHAFVAPMGVHS